MFRSVYVALAACALSVVLSACGSDDNKKPVAADMTLNAVEDASVQVSVIGNDPARTDLTATIVTAPTKGDVVFSGVQFTYTPHPNQNGPDFFTYTFSDGSATSNLGHVSLGIAAVDDLPTIQPTLATDQDTSVTATLITDIDTGDTFNSTIVTPPSHGTLTVDASNAGKFTYQPEAGFSGADSAELKTTQTAFDGTSITASGTVAITVRPKQPGGVADPAPTPLSVTITSAPSVGTAVVNAGGSIQYTRSSPFVGNTSLEYAVGNGPESVKVNASLPAGESIDTLAAAKSAPVVFYLTQQSRQLYRVDLRQPGVAQQVGESSTVREFAIDATGSRVAYTDATGLKLVDLAAPDTVQDLATNARTPAEAIRESSSAATTR